MSCAAGYPKNACPFGFEGRVTRKACGTCKHYVPPPHILQWCMLFDRDGVLCMKPIADCGTCPEKSPKSPERIGQIDWRDPEAVKKFFRENYNSSKARDKMLRFLTSHPNYFKDYQEKNRESVNAAARRWYWKNKEAKARAKAQSSSGKIPGDPP